MTTEQLQQYVVRYLDEATGAITAARIEAADEQAAWEQAARNAELGDSTVLSVETQAAFTARVDTRVRRRRGSAGVAEVEVGSRKIGHVRRFPDRRWRGLPLNEGWPSYDDEAIYELRVGYPSAVEAAEALAAAVLAAPAPARCQWFALCENEATGTTPHPVLGDVPTCPRCAALAAS